MNEKEARHFGLMMGTGFILSLIVMATCILTFWVANGGHFGFSVDLDLQITWTLAAVIIAAIVSTTAVGYTAFKLTK